MKLSRLLRREQFIAPPIGGKMFAKGADKGIFPSTIPGYVVIQPLSRSKNSRFQKEMEKIQKIARANGSIGLHLDTQRTVGNLHSNIPYALAPKAGGDLEQFITNNLSFNKRLQLGLQAVHGVEELHARGYVHGDIKPDNFLIFKEENREVVKLSDFGKTQKLNDKELIRYAGNLRLAAPELVTSRTGDVYSTGMVLVRIMEEANAERVICKLDGKGKYRRGIETLGRSNALYYNICYRIKSIVAVIFQSFFGKRFVNKEDIKRAEKMNAYINTIQLPMESLNSLDSKKLVLWRDLVKRMTATDPNERPTMKTVLKEYKKIDDLNTTLQLF